MLRYVSNQRRASARLAKAGGLDGCSTVSSRVPPPPTLAEFVSQCSGDMQKALDAYASVYRVYCDACNGLSVSTPAAVERDTEGDSCDQLEGSHVVTWREAVAVADDIRSRSSWRSGSVSGRTKSDAALPDYPPGLCYAMLLKPSMVTKAAASLGEWPTVGDVLASDERWFSVPYEMDGLALVPGDKGYHLSHVDSVPVAAVGVLKAYEALVSVAKLGDYAVGSFASLLRRSKVKASIRTIDHQFNSSTRLGGVKESEKRGGLPATGLPLGQKKKLCERCGFLVNPVGHFDRCAVQPEPSPRMQGGWREDELRAWIGDAVFALDVKRRLVATIADHKSLGSEFSALSSNSAMAKYMRVHYPDMLKDCGTSDHSQATVFEKSYSGQFRETYLRRVFGDVDLSSEPDWMPGLLSGFDSSGSLGSVAGSGSGVGRESLDCVRVGQSFSSGGLRVYLAGTSESAEGPGWRENLLPLASKLGVEVCCPRSPDLSHLEVPVVSRTAWENEMMEKADGIIFNFTVGLAASAMLELGLHASSPTVRVVCDLDFPESDLIASLCAAKNIRTFRSVQDALFDVVKSSV